MNQDLYAANKDTLLTIENKCGSLRDLLWELSQIKDKATVEILLSGPQENPNQGTILEVSKQEDEDLFKLLMWKASQKINKCHKDIRDLVAQIVV